MARKTGWLLVLTIAFIVVSFTGIAAPQKPGESAMYPSSVPDCWYETQTVYGPWLYECTCYRCNWTHRCWGDGCYLVNFESRTYTYERRLCCYYDDVGFICDDWQVIGEGQKCREISHSFLGGCGCSSPLECGTPACDCCLES
jgi:hypothetical protein